MAGLVTLTTDFGVRDSYVGAMKGALLSAAGGDLRLVDLSHEIPAQDVLAGALLLRHAAFEFPAGTVHLAVVDPGVGSRRRPLVVDAGGYLWVGPDNGLLTFALAADGGARAYEIAHAGLQRAANPAGGPSATFHGRDVFAPAAARLATGVAPAQVGPVVDDPVRLPIPRATRGAAGLEGSVIHVDHFGNLISCVTDDELAALGPPAHLRVRLGDRCLDLVGTYADVAPGQLAALVGSGGLLEIGRRHGSAAATLGVGPGATLYVETSA